MTTRDPITLESGGVSRREFFVGAGATAGALAALGSVAGLAHAPSAEAAIASRKYYSYQVAFELDGVYGGLLLAAEGGEPVIVTSDSTRIGESKFTSGPMTIQYEPATLALADMSKGVYEWISRTIDGTATGRSASVITATQDLKETYRLEMQNARLTDVTLDSLDAQDLEPARFSVKIAPGTSSHLFGGKGTFRPALVKAAPLTKSNFVLYVQGLETIANRIRFVDRVGFKLRPDGVFAPLPLKFELALADAGPAYKWMNDTLAGKTGPRSGELQLLSRDRTKLASSVTFDQLTVTRVSCPAQGVNGTQTVEVECMPLAARFNPGELVT